MTIGVHGSPWTAETARSEALRLLAVVRTGVDPIAARKKAALRDAELDAAAYVKRFVKDYLVAEWPDTWKTASRQLERYFLPKFKGRSIASIERHEISTIFDNLRSMPAAARNVHAVVRKLFRWAVNSGHIPVSPIADMTAPPAVKARKRVLTPDELLAAWKSSYSLKGHAGPWLRLLIATLQRRNEVSGLSWPELDQIERTWFLPGKRAKNDTDHIVPLNTFALAELDGLSWKRKGLLFTTTGTTPISGFSKVKAALDKAMIPILQKMADDRAQALGEDSAPVVLPRWIFHDIRRTGTTALQSLGIPIEVTERVINHTSGETAGIRGVYNLHGYLHEKRSALDAWGGYLDQLIKGAEVGPNVIALAKRRA